MIRRVSACCCVILMSVLCVALFRADAVDVEGSTQMLCALTRSMECDSDSGCQATTVEALDIPVFIRVDLKKNTATGISPTAEKGKQKVTQIKGVQRVDDMIILQGIEARGWSAVINERSGRMTLTASGDDEAFVIFGSCTKL